MTTTTTFDSLQPTIGVDSKNKMDCENKKWRKWLWWLLTLAIIKMFASDPAIWQEVVTQQTDENNKELIIQTPSQVSDSTIKNRNDAVNWIQTIWDDAWWEWVGIVPDPVWPEADEWDWVEIERDPDWGNDSKKKNPWIEAHWAIQYWTWYAWDHASVCSEEGTLTAVLNLTHHTDKENFGYTIGANFARLEDWKNNPNYPFSKAQIFNLFWQLDFWKKTIDEGGKPHFNQSLTFNTKYARFDNGPEWNWFNPDIIYKREINKWFTFEWAYLHTQVKWPNNDVDWIRAWIMRKAAKNVEITFKARLETVGLDMSSLKSYETIWAKVFVANNVYLDMTFVFNKKAWEIQPVTVIGFAF